MDTLYPEPIYRYKLGTSGHNFMAIPELRQFGDLQAEDFERHPVWIACHTADSDKDKRWFAQTDEETFRPWNGKLPVEAADGMFLVRAIMELRDGSRYPGFVTPAIGGSGQLGIQQPHIFVGNRTFSFWGGMIGISKDEQQALYVTLGKNPDSIFPLRFSADSKLSTGVTKGEVDGFYRNTQQGIQATFAEPLDEREAQAKSTSRLFLMCGNSCQGYPQPGGASNLLMRWKKTTYAGVCPRCGIYDAQISPFRFPKAGRREAAGFMQLNTVPDAFFVRRDIAEEISNAGITGVSFGPALDHRSGTELADRVQMLISTIIPAAETSRLQTVTCRRENEEVLAIRALFAKQPPSPEPRAESLWSVEFKKQIRRDAERLASLPYCGRMKFHWPTSLALLPTSLKDAPDLFQTAEWFGTGAAADRLTIASERFVNLFRERRWKGLVFNHAREGGYSERNI